MQRGVDAVRPQLALKTLTCGGSAPPQEMMQWYLDTLGVEFLQGWGMTETNPLGSLGRVVATHADLAKTPEQRFQNCLKAGLPVYGIQVRIAEPEALDRDVAPGEAGELLVKGPWVIQGYYENPAPEKFHNGWLITGDVARIDAEGAIIICDRSKDVIKSGGEWISSIDMENDITAMPEVTMACVVAVPHPKWDERPIAIVVVAPGQPTDTAAASRLKERVNAHLSSNWAKFQLPDDVLIWPEIPLTSTGKLDKKVVRGELQKQGYVLPTLSKL